jgi:hypothetical protein
VGAKIVGLQSLFAHEIQGSTPQKFADLWDTKCSAAGLATLLTVFSIEQDFHLLTKTFEPKTFVVRNKIYNWAITSEGELTTIMK